MTDLQQMSICPRVSATFHTIKEPFRAIEIADVMYSVNRQFPGAAIIQSGVLQAKSQPLHPFSKRGVVIYCNLSFKEALKNPFCDITSLRYKFTSNNRRSTCIARCCAVPLVVLLLGKCEVFRSMRVQQNNAQLLSLYIVHSLNSCT